MKPDHKFYLSTITCVASLGGLLFGFDMAVVSGALPFVVKQFQLSSLQEGWFVSSALVGCMLGVIFSGELSDRYGRKKLLYSSGLLFLLSAAGCMAAGSFGWLIAARITGGMGVGIASIVVPLYLSEIAPAAVRGRIVTWYQLAITVGIVLAYLSNAYLLSLQRQMPLHMQEVWRWMFAVGIIPALLFLGGLTIVPESPDWLARNKGLSNDTATKTNAVHISTLFTPRLRKALLLGILLPLFSQLSGINAIIYYGPTILSNAGIAMSNSLLGQVIFGMANLVFTFIAIWKVDQWGRRPLYLIGTAGAALSLLFTGFLFYYGQTAGIPLIVGVVLFLACFACSIGPLKFVVASEIFPTAIRGKAMSLSILVMWLADTLVGQLTPMLLRNAGTAVTFWLFSACCILAFFTVYKLLPETKGKSLEDIEAFWKTTNL